MIKPGKLVANQEPKTRLRLAFLCGALEPGRDGVGDYSRRLAGELIRQGHLAVVVALNDSHVTKMIAGEQEIDGTSVPVLRLPDVLPWSDRAIKAHDWLKAFNPDWISLQFVPFGFHPKGLAFGLGKTLRAIDTGASWQVMFHELWLGLGEGSSVKHRITGWLQKYIVLDFMGRLRPRIVHTQTEPYRIVLRRANIVASILPLFANIPRTEADGWEDLLGPLVAKAAGKPQARTKVYLAGILGMVHPEWSAEEAVKTIEPLTQRFQKRLVLVFHGKNGLGPEFFSKLKQTLHGRADIVVCGERTPEEISKILQTLDLGLATSPRQVIQKSGSVVAMQEHGLQVLVTRDDWRLRGPALPPEEATSGLLSPKQFSSLKVLPARDIGAKVESSLRRIADQLIQALYHHSA